MAKIAYWTGKKLSEEHKRKISIANKGKRQTLETIRKRRDSRKGYRHSKETCQKISDSQKGQKRPKITGQKHFGWKGGEATRKARKVINENQRRVWKFDNGGSHSLEQWEELKRKYDFMCLCCKRYEPDIKLTEDHIIPISKNGSNYIENIQPLCRSCNSRKYNKIIGKYVP